MLDVDFFFEEFADDLETSGILVDSEEFEKVLVATGTTFSLFRRSVQWINFFLVPPNILINIYFIWLLCSTDELRIMSFFPIAVQASVAISVEIANSFILLWRIAFDFDIYRNHYYHRSETARTVRAILSTTGLEKIGFCIALFLRQYLANYTTGVTSMAVAVERYLAVCHPFVYRIYIKKSWNKMQCAILAFVMLVPISAISSVKIFEIFNVESDSGQTYCDMQMATANAKEVLTGFVLYFILPVVICGALHYKTIKGLTQLQSNEAQNKLLSRVILFSWTAWVFLWTPDFAVSVISSMAQETYLIINMMSVVSFALKGFFLQINPVLIIANYRPIRERVRALIEAAKLWFLKEDGMENEKDFLNDQNTTIKTTMDENTKIENRIKILFTAFSVFLAVVFGLTCSVHFSNGSNVVKVSETSSIFRTASNNLIGCRQNILDGLKLHRKDPQFLCRDLNGTISWKFKRCFVFRHNAAKLNFTEQVSNCKHTELTAVFPRYMDEVRYLVDFYKFMSEDLMGCSSLQDQPLPLGFDTPTYASILTSVDNKYYIPEKFRSEDLPHSREDPNQQPVDLSVPMEFLRMGYHVLYDLELLCYSNHHSAFKFCSRQAKRKCHMCFKDL